MRLRYDANKGKEVYHLTMCQPTARKAVRLQALLPTKDEERTLPDKLDKLEVNIRPQFYFSLQSRIQSHGFHMENLGKWENFFHSGRSQRILQMGKVREFYPKYWEKKGILASYFFLSDFLIEVFVK